MRKKKKSRPIYKKGRLTYKKIPIKIIFTTKDGKKIAFKGTQIIPKVK